jgi:hypothetical protein
MSTGCDQEVNALSYRWTSDVTVSTKLAVCFLAQRCRMHKMGYSYERVRLSVCHGVHCGLTVWARITKLGHRNNIDPLSLLTKRDQNGVTPRGQNGVTKNGSNWKSLITRKRCVWRRLLVLITYRNLYVVFPFWPWPMTLDDRKCSKRDFGIWDLLTAIAQ